MKNFEGNVNAISSDLAALENLAQDEVYDLAEERQMPEQPRLDRSRMQGVHCHIGSRHPSGQLTGKQQVGQLGIAINMRRLNSKKGHSIQLLIYYHFHNILTDIIVSLGVEVVQLQIVEPVSNAGYDDDAPALAVPVGPGRVHHERDEQVPQEEVAKVIRGHVQLVALLRHVLLVQGYASIQHQHI